MAQSQLALYNLVYSLLGGRGSTISAVDESSIEGQQINAWYATVRDQVLRLAPWASAKKTALLGSQATQVSDLRQWVAGGIPPDWQYSYATPADMLQPQYLQDLERFSLGPSKLYTNADFALLTYTYKVTDPAVWEANLYSAIAHRLASQVGGSLGRNQNQTNYNYQMSEKLIVEARVVAANAETHDVETLPDWLSLRGYSILPYPGRSAGPTDAQQ